MGHRRALWHVGKMLLSFVFWHCCDTVAFGVGLNEIFKSGFNAGSVVAQNRASKTITMTMMMLVWWTCTGLHPVFPLPQLEVQSPKMTMMKSIRSTHRQRSKIRVTSTHRQRLLPSFASHRFFSFTSILHWSRCNLKSYNWLWTRWWYDGIWWCSIILLFFMILWWW